MTFHNVRFPTAASWGYTAYAQFRTQVHTGDGGLEERVSRWPRPRRGYNAPLDREDPDLLHEILKFFLCRKGGAVSWRLKDHLDFTTALNGRDAPTYQDQYLGDGDGTRTTFQLLKKYQNGSFDHTEEITHPVVPAASAGAEGETLQTVVVGVNGTQVTEAGNWSVDGTTGAIVFTTPPPAGQAVEAGCEFDRVVRFNLSDDKLGIPWEAFDAASVAEMSLIEVLAEGSVPETIDYGGTFYNATFSASLQLTHGKGRLYVLTPQSAGLSLYLPVQAGLGSGWALFVIVNQSGSYDLTVRDDLGTSLGLVSPAQRKYVCLRDNGDGTATWSLF